MLTTGVLFVDSDYRTPDKKKPTISYELRKAVLINTMMNKPYIKRKFTKAGLMSIERNKNYFNSHLKAFGELPYRKNLICTHDSNNKNFVDLMINVDFEQPTFSKEKREKEVISKTLHKESLFELLTIGTSFVQNLQQWYNRNFS